MSSSEMLSALAAFVEARPEGTEQFESPTREPNLTKPGRNIVSSRPHTGSNSPPQTGSDRANTASTCATDEGLFVQLEHQTPFLVEVRPIDGGIPLGIIVSCDDHPAFLTIDGIHEQGLIAEWNASHGEELTVRQHQIIASVNGISNSAQDMLAALKRVRQGVTLKLLIQGSRQGFQEREASAPEVVLEAERTDSSTIVSIDGPSVSLDKVISIDGVVPEEMLAHRRPFIVQLTLGRKDLPLGMAVSFDAANASILIIDNVFLPGLIAEWNSSNAEDCRVNVGDTITGVNMSSGNGKELLHILTSIHHMNKGAMMNLMISPCNPWQKRRSRR